ncbi:hypothetical protein BGW41_004705 [Actinomortierella wolfii]|nr:hypothetical protein BGW41_004705 [Actinomortierella wolfii]
MSTSPLEIYELRMQIQRYMSRQDCCRACLVSRAWYTWFNPVVWCRIPLYRPMKHNLARNGHHVRSLAIQMPLSYPLTRQSIGLRRHPLQPTLFTYREQRLARDVFQYCGFLEQIEINTGLCQNDPNRVSVFLWDLIPTRSRIKAMSSHYDNRLDCTRHSAHYPDQGGSTTEGLPLSKTASVRSLVLLFNRLTAKTVLTWLLKVHRQGHFAHLRELELQSDTYSLEIMPLIEAIMIKVITRFRCLKTLKFSQKAFQQVDLEWKNDAPPLTNERLEHDEDDENDDHDGGNDDDNDSEQDMELSSKDVKQPPSLETLLLGPVKISANTIRRLGELLSNVVDFRALEKQELETFDALACNFHSLQQIVIGPSSTYYHCPYIKTASLRYLGKVHPWDIGRIFLKWPNLRYVDVGVSPGVSALHAFQQFGQWCTAPMSLSKQEPSTKPPLLSHPTSASLSLACAHTLRYLSLKNIRVLTIDEAHTLRSLLNHLPSLRVFVISADRIHQGIFFDESEIVSNEDMQREQKLITQASLTSTPQSESGHEQPSRIHAPTAIYCPSLVRVYAFATFLAPVNLKQLLQFLRGAPQLKAMEFFTLDAEARAYVQRHHLSTLVDYF